MLLRISVLQYKGTPPQAALAYMFDEGGGTIGRENCNLTLPDPSRVLSRVQAQIVFADGQFSLLDQGGNPSIVNGLRVGKGLSRPLYDGDIIELCDYKLRAKAIGAAVTASSPPGGSLRAREALLPEELAPPILLDPDELTGHAVLAEPAVMQMASAPASHEPEVELEMHFDMDVIFDDEPETDVRAGRTELPQPAELPAVAELTRPARTGAAMDAPAAEHLAALSALLLGLGVELAPAMRELPPQHLGIVMRRAMQRALANALAQLSPEELARRLAAHEHASPGERSHQLWSLYAQHHAQISHEVQDQFHALFGRELIAACEAQQQRLGKAH